MSTEISDLTRHERKRAILTTPSGYSVEGALFSNNGRKGSTLHHHLVFYSDSNRLASITIDPNNVKYLIEEGSRVHLALNESCGQRDVPANFEGRGVLHALLESYGLDKPKIT